MSGLPPLPAVPPGGVLRVVAPAGAVRAAVVEEGARRLRQRGFEVQVDPQVALVDPQAPFLAGTDAQRAQALQRALTEPGVDAVLCARGGYGAMRLLPLLDWRAIASQARLLVGFSDITALHGALAVHAQVPSLHGPLLSTLPLHCSPEDPDGDEALDALCQAMQGQRRRIALETLRPGVAHGPLLGGNLSLLASLVGSAWFPPLEGALLYLEEIGESAYRVDRMLTSLSLRGVWDQVAGVILGDTGGGGDHYMDAEALEPFARRRVLELVGGRDIPVACAAPLGHRARNLALPFAVPGALRCQPEGAWLEPGPLVKV